MTMWLKQSTAVVVSFGPFVSPVDGVTLQTGLVSAIDHATTGIMLSKNGGALTIRHQNVTASTYDAYGNYRVTLDTTDTNTLGTLRMQFAAAASCLPVWQDFLVVPANVWDSYLGADRLSVDVEEIGANIITAAAINDGAIDAATFAASAINAAAIATGAITNAKFAAGAIDAAAIADAAIDNATFAADVGSTAYATNIIALAADKALVNENLDHLAKVTTAAADMTTEVVDGSIISRMISNSDTSLFVPGTHSLQIVGADVAAVHVHAGAADLATVAATVQADCNAALVANNLDHLALTATGSADMTTEVADNTILARVLGNGDTSTFVPSTDGLHAANVDNDAIITDVAAVHVHAATIEADTNELQTDWVNGGRLDLILDSITPAGIWDLTHGVETGLTPRQALRLIAAACAGKVSGAGTATVVIRNAVADGTDSIVATVDASGNRTAIAYDLT